MDNRIYDGFDKYRIGLRNIKTALAVLLCLLTQFLFPQISALNAGIAAVVVMRETPEESIETGINRFIGTMIGGLFGYVLLILSGIMPLYNQFLYVLLIPALMMLAISTCVWLKKYDSVVICCVVYLIIALEIGDNRGSALSYVAMRMLDTIIGIGFATVINKYFFPYYGKQKK
ncbi:MAG: hypothetical protein PWP10_4223 [Clostridiales bacterium]|jgi:uncharacterized membrane protein YgaE (UPF0421/DUF939 family)|nr:hypothetical protein [Clostridiales bacterium]